MGTQDNFPTGSDIEEGDSGSEQDNTGTTQDFPSGRPAGSGPHPTGPTHDQGEGGPKDLPPKWLALIEAFPNWEARIRASYASAWAAGNIEQQYNRITKQIPKIIEAKKDAKKDAKEAPDPWLETISATYSALWGENIPESEIQLARDEGMNAYEFVAYQRSKSAFTSTEVYERESTARAGSLANMFGMGMQFSGSPSPNSGAGVVA